MKQTLKMLPVLFVLFVTGGCNSVEGPMETVEYVDLEKFMGDWYVIASIPTFMEKQAVNPVESYALNEDGTVATTFSFERRGDARELTGKAFIRDESSNAIWGMQFVWPVKADYRIVYLDPEYATTIIGRVKRDYLWIMSRSPSVSPARLDELINIAVDMGYDRSKIELSSWQLNATEQQAATTGS